MRSVHHFVPVNLPSTVESGEAAVNHLAGFVLALGTLEARERLGYDIKSARCFRRRSNKFGTKRDLTLNRSKPKSLGSLTSRDRAEA